MGEHVHEVEDDDVEWILLEAIEVRQKAFAEACFVDLIIGEGIVLAVALQEGLDHGLLVEILPFFALLVDPQLGEHLRNIQGHQPGEDRIAGVLRRRRQDGEVEVFVEGVEFAQHRLDALPLVVAEVVDEDEEDLLSRVKEREDLRLEEVGAHQGASLWFAYPALVVATDEAGEEASCFGLLHLEKFLHLWVAFLELELPVHQTAIELLPLFYREAVAHLSAELCELLPVVHHRGFVDDGALVEVLLQRQEELIWIDGLDQVIGDLPADGLVHQLLLFALSDHDDGHEGAKFFDSLQGVEARQAGHVFVEEDQVEGLALDGLDGIGSAQDGRHFVALVLEEEDVRLEQVDLVVGPKDLIDFIRIHDVRRYIKLMGLAPRL